MIRNVIFILLSAISVTGFAQLSQETHCAQFDKSGNVIKWLGGEGCALKWDKAICTEVTSGSVLIQEIQNKDICRCNVGTSYTMSGDFCGEFTPEGTKLRWLDDKSLCYENPGVVKKRCE